MSRYHTLEVEAAALAIERAKIEPLIVDGVLVAIIVGLIRIYASKDKFIVSEQEPKQ